MLVVEAPVLVAVAARRSSSNGGDSQYLLFGHVWNSQCRGSQHGRCNGHRTCNHNMDRNSSVDDAIMQCCVMDAVKLQSTRADRGKISQAEVYQ